MTPPKNEFVCDVCHKKYKTKKYFNKHVASHQPDPSTVGVVAQRDNVEPSTSKKNEHNPMETEDCQGSELPEGYNWGLWSENDEEDEVSTYFVKEFEDEEERREKTVDGTDKKSKRKKSESARVKCCHCPSSFSSIDGYIKHRVGHGMKAAYLRRPTEDVFMTVAPDLARKVLESIGVTNLTGHVAPKVAIVAQKLLSSFDDPDAKNFVMKTAVLLLSSLQKDSEEFLFPSQFAVNFYKKTSRVLVNANEISSLMELLERVVLSEIAVLQVFVPEFILKFADKVLAHTLHTMTFGDASASATSISEQYLVTNQSTDSVEFKQSIHYIGGSNVKSVLRTAFRDSNPNSEWRRVIATIRSNFIINSLAAAPPQELIAWTLTQDRGKLQKISDRALSFFIELAKIVKPLERLNGSLLNSEVFDAVGQSTKLLSQWDILKGSLSESESFKLLHALISHFCVTWRNGILTRRQDEMALATKYNQKFGTGGVAFRAKLSGT